MAIHRRGFLALGAAGLTTVQDTLAIPLPAKAKITSSVMLWTLSGSFEERVKIAALAGIQTVGLLDEYAKWDYAATRKVKRYVESFGMAIETIAAMPASMIDPASRGRFLKETGSAIDTAKQLDNPKIILRSGNAIGGRAREEQYAGLLESAKQAAALAAAAGVTLMIEPVNDKIDHKGMFLATCGEGLKFVKEVDNPHFRLLFNVYHEQVQQGSVVGVLRDALDFTAMVQIADAPGRNDPGTGAIDFKEIYRVLAKGGYSHSVAMEYLPKRAPIASLKKAVDSFRSDVNERSVSATPTEGALV